MAIQSIMRTSTEGPTTDDFLMRTDSQPHRHRDLYVTVTACGWVDVFEGGKWRGGFTPDEIADIAEMSESRLTS